MYSLFAVTPAISETLIILTFVGTVASVSIGVIASVCLWLKQKQLSRWGEELAGSARSPIQEQFERRWMPDNISKASDANYESHSLESRVLAHYRALWAIFNLLGILPFIIGTTITTIAVIEHPQQILGYMPCLLGLVTSGMVLVFVWLQRYKAMQTIHVGIQQLVQKVLTRIHTREKSPTNDSAELKQRLESREREIAELTAENERLKKAKPIMAPVIAPVISKPPEVEKQPEPVAEVVTEPVPQHVKPTPTPSTSDIFIDMP